MVDCQKLPLFFWPDILLDSLWFFWVVDLHKSIFCTNILSQLEYALFSFTGINFLKMPIEKISEEVFVVTGHLTIKKTTSTSPFPFFPERLGEGRFLGAVSLSSLTWLAWFKLLNLNLLDLTCLTWTCLTKTFLTWLSWLDLGKLLTWSA